jgi:hypothetical protein
MVANNHNPSTVGFSVLLPLSTISDIEDDTLSHSKGRDLGPFKDYGADENFPAPSVRSNESATLVRLKRLHSAQLADQ